MKITDKKGFNGPAYVNVKKRRYLRDFLNDYINLVNQRSLSTFYNKECTKHESTYSSRSLYSLFQIAKTYYPSTTEKSFNKAIIYNVKNKNWKFRICSTSKMLVINSTYIRGYDSDKTRPYLVEPNKLIGHRLMHLHSDQYYNKTTCDKLFLDEKK